MLSVTMWERSYLLKQVIFESDWLSTEPFFYNECTNKASSCIHDVIDSADFEWDPEGFNNYLAFGYSVFEQTPIRHVKFLRHSSQLLADEEGRLSVNYLQDPAEKLLGKPTTEDDVWDLIRVKIQAWERSVEGEIILPLSGGYDSRILAAMVKEKSRIRAFTYGISDRQEESFEVVFARELARRLGCSWTHVPLGAFHRYLDDWDRFFGVFTHAHGMYHMEFYRGILDCLGPGRAWLSGFGGDWFSGGVAPVSLLSAESLPILGYTHGVNADRTQSNLRDVGTLREAYWVTHKDELQSPVMQSLHRARMKAGLTSFLMLLPRSLGYEPYPPYADIEVAMAMLNLPDERRRNRAWQQRFFQRQGLDLEALSLRASPKNSLDLQALRYVPLLPLDSRRLAEVVRPEYVEWINRQLQQNGRMWNMLWRSLPRGSLGKALAKCGLRDQRLEAYAAYMTLRPIEKLIRRRDAVDSALDQQDQVS
jgi:hypothetical protein